MSKTPSGSAYRIQPLSKPPSVQQRHSTGISSLPTASHCHAFAFNSGAGRDTACSRLRNVSNVPPEPVAKQGKHSPAVPGRSSAPSMKTGGMVKKTGLHYLHKGEMVVPVKDVSKVKKVLKKKS